jgi:hypothetical protein
MQLNSLFILIGLAGHFVEGVAVLEPKRALLGALAPQYNIRWTESFTSFAKLLVR